MKVFKKNRPPKALIDFQKKINDPNNFKPNDTFEALKSDEITNIAVQNALAQEQGYLCCYCMGEIKTYKDSKERKRVKIEIEHYKPKSIFNGTKNDPNKNKLLCDNKSKKRTDLRIKYTNLLGACGITGQCGNTKGDIELCYIPNPSQTKQQQFPVFSYNMKGKIRPSDKYDPTQKEAIKYELDNIIGLNSANLKSRRRNKWVGIRNTIKRKCKINSLHTGGQKEINYVKGLIDIYSKKRIKDDKFYEYYPCMIHLLKREYKKELSI